MNGQRSDGADLDPPWRSLALVTGEVVVIETEDLVSGGYQWAVLTIPDGVTDVSDDQPTDGGGTSARTVLLRGDAPGAYDVVLGLVRPWEPAETPPAQLRTIALHVQTRVLPLPEPAEGDHSG